MREVIKKTLYLKQSMGGTVTGMEEYTKYLSCKTDKFYHSSTGSYTINNTLKVRKYYVQWYYGKNYTNHATNENWFQYGIWG